MVVCLKRPNTSNEVSLSCWRHIDTSFSNPISAFGIDFLTIRKLTFHIVQISRLSKNLKPLVVCLRPDSFWAYSSTSENVSSGNAKVNQTKLKLDETKKNLVCILKQQMFGMFLTKKSKFVSLELITTISVTLVCLLTSDALLCGIQTGN